MESSILAEKHPEGGLGESSHVVEVPRTQKARMASVEWSRQGAKEMRSEILIRIPVVQSSADLLKKVDLILNSTEAMERFSEQESTVFWFVFQDDSGFCHPDTIISYIFHLFVFYF